MQNLFFGLFLCMLTGSIVAADERVVLVDGPEVDLMLDDVKKALLSVPKDVRAAMLTDQQRLRYVVNSTYMTKVAAYRARQKQLDKKKEVEALIWNRTQNILANAEIQRVVEEELASNESYEPVAYEEYLANQEQYRMLELVEASHILFRVDDETDEQEVLRKARQVRTAILSGEISFDKAAYEYSEDAASAAKGGSVGRFGRGRMVGPFEDAAFALKAGEISEPVKTRYGYHLILVSAHIPASIKPFEQVKQGLIKAIQEKVEGRIKRDYWLQLEGDKNLKLNDAAIDSFVKNPVLY